VDFNKETKLPKMKQMVANSKKQCYTVLAIWIPYAE